MKLLTASWVFVALVMATAAAAQQGTTDLRGRVIDAQGAVLPGVTVNVKNQDTGMFRDTVSGADGSFIASGLVPGTYEVTAELQGFKTFNRRGLRLEVGRTASIDVELQVGGVSEVISVSAETPLVDMTSKEIGGNITSETLVQLPSVNGNFIGFVGLLPGIVPSVSTESFGSDSISVNGQDPRNNNYMLDGGNNNDDVIGQRAGTQARTPIEAIQEFQVITGQYDAQYGRTSGAVVNAVTKAGTNQFKGVAFGFLQNASLTTKDFFAKQNGTAKPDTSYQRWGGTFGGPIVMNKIHFFGSLERFAIDRPNTINIPSRPEYNGTQVTEDRVWNTVIRGDHQVNNANTYSVRWLREQSPQVNQIIATGTQAAAPAAAREESDVDQTVSANWNTVISGTKVSTFRVTWTRENVTFANNCFNTNGRDMLQCPVTLGYQDYIDQQDNTAQARINDGIQAEETLAWFLPDAKGSHDIKFGVQYLVLGRLQHQPGQHQQHVLVRPQQHPVQPRRALHLPGPADRPCRRREHVLREGPLPGRVRAGQMAARAERHAEHRRPLRLRDDSARGDRRSPGGRVSARSQQPGAAPRPDLPGGRQERPPRGIRSLLRQDELRDHHRPLYGNAVHEFVRGELPDGRG